MRLKISILVLSILLLAGCSRSIPEGDPSQEIPTVSQDSQDTGDNRITSRLPQGSKSIKLTTPRSYSLNDTWTRRILHEGLLSPDKIVDWIAYGDNEPWIEQSDVKSFDLRVFGWEFKIIDGALLSEYLTCHNCEAVVQEDDLVVKASLDDDSKVLLVIDNTLDVSYLIENTDNRYWESIAMIRRNEFTVIDVTRKSDAESLTLSYDDGEKVQRLAQAYEAYNELFSMAYEAVVAPTGTELLLTSQYASPNAQVYHLTYQSWWNNNLVDRLTSDNKFAAASQMRFYEKDLTSLQELKKWSTGRTVTVSEEQKQAILFVEPTYSFFIEINTTPFAVAFDFNYNDQYQPYNWNIWTDHRLDEEMLQDQLAVLFGENMSSVYGNWYFTYQPIPGESYDKVVTIASIFGEEVKTRVQYSTPNIDSRAIEQSILSNTTISILPKSGVFQDVLLQYKNIESFDVNFEACSIDTSPDMLQDYKWQWVENYLFVCDANTSESVVVEATDEKFEYWRAYRTPVWVPDSLRDASAFRVRFTDVQWQLHSHYLLKSDIWVWWKVSDSSLWLWAFGMEDGKLLENAVVTVKTLGWSIVDTVTLQQWQTKIWLPEPVSGYDERWKDSVFLVEVTNGESMTLMVVDYYGGNSVSIPSPWPNGNDYRYLAINSRLTASEVAWSDQDAINERGEFESLKVYGYADRGMYKAWETIHVGWFVRDVLLFDEPTYLENITVTVTISQSSEENPYVLESLTLDRFGGFEWSFELPKSAQLGDYLVEYQIDQHEASSYSHIVKVEEYQKPTFYASMSTNKSDGILNVSIAPEYYFGSPLSNYDINLTRSLAWQDICWYCRWRNEDEWYFNQVFDTSSSTGWNVILYWLDTPTSEVELLPFSSLANQGYAYTLKLSLIVKDTIAGETQYFTEYVDFDPKVMIGLSWQPVERLYKNDTVDTLKDWNLDWVVTQWLESVDTIEYEIYYHGYEQTLKKWVDAHLYYINNYPYTRIGSGSISTQSEFSVPTQMISDPGSYLLRIIARDEEGKSIGEVQKRIERYVYGWISDGMMWSVPNNYSLIVAIPEKTFNEWESLPIDIMPYQKGSQVVVTVEKGQYILDSYVITLDGWAINIPVKPWYAPQVTISVMQLQSSDANESARKEPRFFAGYKEVSIDTAMHTLDIRIETDKKVYAPGDEVLMTITTTDYQWNLIDARVSLSVIDQALANLYHTIKEPLPYFFSEIGTSVATYTNMKLLYQSLKVFSTGWAKGWSGQWWKWMFAYVRDDLKDTAFWSWGVITQDWVATFGFVLPENLTTWMIDAVGISSDTRLGVATESITVTKDLIIETNPPLYLTLGDSIELPIKAIVPWEIQKGEIVQWEVWVTNAFGDRYELWWFETLPWRKVSVPLSFPVERRDSPYVTVHVSWKYGDVTDGISQIIPVRTDGLLMRESQWTLSSQWVFDTVIPKSYTSTITTRLSSLPTSFLWPLAAQVLTHDLWSTHQAMTAVWWVIALEEFKRSWRFENELFDEWIIHASSWPQTIQQFIDNGLSTVLSHQQWDWWFSYRWNNYDTATPELYWLSAYIYGGLLEIQAKTTNKVWLTQSIDRVEQFLWKYRMIDQNAYVYSLMQYSFAWWVLTNQQQNVLDEIVSFNTPWYLPLMRYVIAVSQEEEQSVVDQWRRVGVVPTNINDRSIQQAFINQITAEAFLLRAKSLDSWIDHQDRLDTLMRLLKLRWKDGLRWGNINDSLQVMLSIRELISVRPTSETITCTLINNGVEKVVQIEDTSSLTFSESISWADVHVERSCDSPVLIDTIVTVMPYDLNAVSDADRHVTSMDRTLSDYEAKIGSEVTLIWSFVTDVSWEQVVVDLFVPADYKLLSVVSSRDNNQTYPFEVSDRHCYPDHWETRFDRLMLYYDTLEAWVCDISIDLLKAYDGTTTVMPMRVQEMYRGDINGRKVISKWN